MTIALASECQQKFPRRKYVSHSLSDKRGVRKFRVIMQDIDNHESTRRLDVQQYTKGILRDDEFVIEIVGEKPEVFQVSDLWEKNLRHAGFKNISVKRNIRWLRYDKRKDPTNAFLDAFKVNIEFDIPDEIGPDMRESLIDLAPKSPNQSAWLTKPIMIVTTLVFVTK